MCFHTEYVIEKWCKTCTNPTSYTLSYTRNSLYLLPFSLCGVGNVGYFQKTFFGNGEGRASERKTVSTVFLLLLNLESPVFQTVQGQESMILHTIFIYGVIMTYPICLITAPFNHRAIVLLPRSSVAISGTEKIMESSPDTVWCRVASLYTFC